MDSSDHLLIEQVQFDVAVTAEEDQKTGGGVKAGIQVLGIGASMGMDNTSRNSTVSRIQFSVPVKYPLSPNDRGISEPTTASFQRQAIDAVTEE